MTKMHPDVRSLADNEPSHDLLSLYLRAKGRLSYEGFRQARNRVTMANVITIFPVIMFGLLASQGKLPSPASTFGTVISALFLLPICLLVACGYAYCWLAIKRLHDGGMSGWRIWALVGPGLLVIPLGPVVYWLYFRKWLESPGTPRPNAYGDQPTP